MGSGGDSALERHPFRSHDFVFCSWYNHCDGAVDRTVADGGDLTSGSPGRAAAIVPHCEGQVARPHSRRACIVTSLSGFRSRSRFWPTVVKSFVRVSNVNPGFNAQSLYEVNFKFLARKYDDDNAAVRANRSDSLCPQHPRCGVGCACQHTSDLRKFWRSRPSRICHSGSPGCCGAVCFARQMPPGANTWPLSAK